MLCNERSRIPAYQSAFKRAVPTSPRASMPKTDHRSVTPIHRRRDPLIASEKSGGFFQITPCDVATMATRTHRMTAPDGSWSYEKPTPRKCGPTSETYARDIGDRCSEPASSANWLCSQSGKNGFRWPQRPYKESSRGPPRTEQKRSHTEDVVQPINDGDDVIHRKQIP